MSAGKNAASETFDWYVEADHAVAGSRGHAYSRARRSEERAHSLGLVITTSLLFVLLASAILFGGHAAVTPFLRRAMAARDANVTGDIVYTMPDGVFCRHMSFDNGTGEITEGAVEKCEDQTGGDRFSSSKFKWGAN
jgi:hypothetical protein